jgi:periplasmic copper chaperone A
MNQRISFLRRWCLTGLLGAAAALALAHDYTLAGVKIEHPWARPTVPGQHTGGAFLLVSNPGTSADRLLGGRTPAAERVEMHTMRMEGEVMRMRELAAVDVPARGRVEFKPGALHLMLTGLKAPLKAGDKVPLVLRFEKAGEIEVSLQVENAPPEAAHKH